MSLAGQPCSATVTFKDATSTLADPAEVIFTVTGPRSVGSTVYKFGVATNTAHVGLGTYSVTFTPTRGGTWTVDADGFDNQGRSVEATQGSIAIDARVAPIPTP